MNEHFSALTAVRSLQAAINVVHENDLAVLGDTNHDIQTAADELDELLSGLFDRLEDQRAFA